MKELACKNAVGEEYDRAPHEHGTAERVPRSSQCDTFHTCVEDWGEWEGRVGYNRMVRDDRYDRQSGPA